MLLFFVASLCAQTPARYTVSGMVVNSVTNEPIRRALVAVSGALVFTGTDGRFEAANVPEGQTMIAVRKPGFFDTPSSNVRINVQAGLRDIVLKLAPEAAVEGKIVDDDADPVSGIEVQALSRRIIDGTRQLRREGAATTDERGYYRIDGLMAGTFVLKTSAAMVDGLNALIPGAPPMQTYPPGYYPNATDASAAQNIELAAGARQEADFTFKAVPAFHISGSLPAGIPGLSMECENAEGSYAGMAQINPKTGKFVVFGVPAGDWYLVAHYVDSTGANYFAREPVTVGSKDVEGLTILPQPLATIPVNVENRSGEPAPLIGVELQRIDGTRTFGISMSPGEDRRIADVIPGTYRVIVPPSGEGCVDSLTSGNIDLTREPLTVAAGSQPQPINVEVGRDCASLQVSARWQHGGDFAFVVVTSAVDFRPPLVGIVQQGGSFSFRSMAPGEYTVYAFSQIDGIEYRNSEALSRFPGRQIVLSANEQATVTLDVSDTGGQ